MKDIRNLASNEFEAVNALIIDQLASDVDLVENIGQYLINAGGKRLRPLLSLLCAKALNTNNQHHITFATVIEFIHSATLLHDDVVDVSMLRRGMPTANAKWGNAPSVLVGDFIYSRAFQLLVRLSNFEIMGLMANTTNEIAEGEVLQLTKAGNPDTSVDEYFEVIRRKTAILFAAACEGAAILAGADKTQQQALQQYGMHLGVAFQLVDDVLDYEGDPEETGKNLGDDLAEGKPTLPLIYAMQDSSAEDREIIRQAISNKDGDKLNKIIELVHASNALPRIKTLNQEHTEAAIEQLATLDDTPFKQGLIELAKLAQNRTN